MSGFCWPLCRCARRTAGFNRRCWKDRTSKAIQSVDDRAAGIVDEWIRLVEIPAPSGKEQTRAKYIRAEMEKLGLSEIKTDGIFNVSGVRKGTGGGPTVVFAAHTDTVFPEGTD